MVDVTHGPWDNNMVENFNAWILKARYMPIRTMLEFIRKKSMNMLGMKGTLCESGSILLVIYVMKIFRSRKG